MTDTDTATTERTITLDDVEDELDKLPEDAATQAAALLKGDLDGQLPEELGDRDKVLANLMESYGNDAKRIAQAVAVVGLRHGSNIAWWKAGQAVGLGTEGKNRSGGSGARARYLAAIGRKDADQKMATAVAGRIVRAVTADQAELKAIKKGGGFYDLVPPAEVGGETLDQVRGSDKVPEGYTIVENGE